MLRRILVTLDGSALAERALPVATGLARASGATVTLLRVCSSHSPSQDGDCGRYVRKVASRSDLGGCVSDAAVAYGDPAEQILAEAARRDVDLIVIATHGRSGVGRWVYGSVAEGVLARSTVPVVLVHAWGEGAAAPALTNGAQIVVPLDGSPLAERALPVARDFAGALRGPMLLLSAVPEPWALLEAASQSGAALPVEDVVAEEEHEAAAYLRGQRQALAAAGYDVHAELRVGPPADEIVGAARDAGAALVVMATHGRSGLARTVAGSVADAVMRHGPCPVVLVRPRAGS